MRRASDEKNVVRKPAPFNGTGDIIVRDILNGEEELWGKGRVFCHTSVPAGSCIGVHRHNNESETYYILSGHGQYFDDGAWVEFAPGDVLYCGDGETHSIKAVDEQVEMICLILFHHI